MCLHIFFEDYNLIIPSLEERSTKILETLAKTLCPHLGSKGSIAHDEIQCGYRGMFDIQGNLMKTVDMGLSIASTPHWHKLIKCFLRGFLLEVCYYQCSLIISESSIYFGMKRGFSYKYNIL
ncbi:hypothetical protein ACJX0J_003121, partial (mitochondrion) [Zea mays]